SVQSTGTDAISVHVGAAIQIKNLTLGTSRSGNALWADYHARIDVLSGVTFSPTAGAHMGASNHGEILIHENYRISGNAVQHLFSQQGGIIFTDNLPHTIIGGAQTFATFAVAGDGGLIAVPFMTYSGMSLAKGQRFKALTLGAINTGGAGPNYFPGNSAG